MSTNKSNPTADNVNALDVSSSHITQSELRESEFLGSATLSAIKVSGTERREFLQGQLTQDMTLVQPDKPMLAGWTSAKGRLLLLAWVIDWHDALWLIAPTELCTAAAKRLKMFVLRAKVDIEVAVDVRVYIAPDASVSKLDSFSKEDTSNCFHNDYSYFFRPTNSFSYWLELSTAERAVSAPGDTQWRLANIEHALPSVWPETHEAFIPQMLNLDVLDGISFTKGCYVGQEIVARTQNLGRIKRRMYKLRAQNGTGKVEIQPGAAISNAQSKNVGQVVDAITIGKVTEILAVVRTEVSQDPLLTENGLTLELMPLPYGLPE